MEALTSGAAQSFLHRDKDSGPQSASFRTGMVRMARCRKLEVDGLSTIKYLGLPRTHHTSGECSMDKQTFQDWLTWSFSPSISAILITFLVALLLPILVHHQLYRSRAATVVPTFVLVGPSGAGKTTLLTQVRA